MHDLASKISKKNPGVTPRTQLDGRGRPPLTPTPSTAFRFTPSPQRASPVLKTFRRPWLIDSSWRRRRRGKCSLVDDNRRLFIILCVQRCVQPDGWLGVRHRRAGPSASADICKLWSVFVCQKLYFQRLYTKRVLWSYTLYGYLVNQWLILSYCRNIVGCEQLLYAAIAIIVRWKWHQINLYTM